MRSKSRFTTLVLLETRESYLQIRVQSQDTRTLSTSSKCHLRGGAASLNRPIAFDGGYHSSPWAQRPVGIKSAVLTLYRRLPVYPDNQTLLVSLGMSQTYHLRTYAMQQNPFDHLVRGSEKGGWDLKTKRSPGLETGAEKDLA